MDAVSAFVMLKQYLVTMLLSERLHTVPAFTSCILVFLFRIILLLWDLLWFGPSQQWWDLARSGGIWPAVKQVARNAAIAQVLL